MKGTFLVVPLLASILFATACSRRSEPQGSATAAASTSATPGSPAASSETKPGAVMHDLAWTEPPGWQKVNSSSSMRKATYKVPATGKDSDEGEMAVFYFRGEGGSTEANIQRWITQFPDAKPSDVKRTQRTVAGMNQTIVEVEGTYASGMPGAGTSPKTGYRLIGVVVETPNGPYFFKLTGPKNTVEGARGTFLTMLDSVKSS